MPSSLIPPHGDSLLDLLVDDARRGELRQASRDMPSWSLTARQLCDLELLLSGAYSPLRGFMVQADHERVCREMRLEDGTLWPLPVELDVTEELAGALAPGDQLALRDPEGVVLAVLHLDDVYRPDRDGAARACLGTSDPEHPGFDAAVRLKNPVNLGGTLEGLALPAHYDFRPLRHTPAELRAQFKKRGWRRTVAYHTRHPMHRAQQELTFRAARELQANLLIHPAVGTTRADDLEHYTRVRCYQAILPTYPRNTVMLSLLPLAVHMAGSREALLHAIVRRNYGCTHIIVDPDLGGSDDEAQALWQSHGDELGIEMVPFRRLVYLEDKDTFVPEDEPPGGSRVKTLSRAELQKRLEEGRSVPAWFSYPEVVQELRKTHPPKNRQGFTVFFTGLSGAGKSTLANVLLVKLLEMGGRPVTLLDGDIVRKNLSSELGFSREHRDLNVLRIGFVASEITKNGGIAICAPIAPYDRVRRDVRETIAPVGGFVLVHVATELSVCESRDRKGMYAKARQGIIKNFTGISDPYEEPADADVIVDTADLTPEEGAQQVLLYLERAGFIA